jgi:hypothetical protein
MTIDIAENVPRISYSVAQGVTQTSFAVPFEFFDDSDLNVYVDGTLKTITTNYTVSGGSGTTGTVTMSVTGGTGGSTVILTRDIPLDRTTDFPTSGAFQIAALNTELDRMVAIQADLQDDINRSLRLTDYDASVSLVLPDVTTRKGKTLAFNLSTGAVESGPLISDTQTVADASADIELLADIQDGTVATNAITNVNTIRTDVTTVAGISANVTTVAGISADITTVVTNIVDIQNAEANADAAIAAKVDALAAQAAAESAQANAEAALDAFTNTYLGAFATDPTLDNDGLALTAGDLYFNTTSNVLKVYNGSAWQAAALDAGAFLAAANNLSDLASDATARTNLGVEIGVDVQAYDATIVVDADIGVTVQAYDADTAKLDVAQSFTAAQRGSTDTATLTGDTTLDFATNQNFVLTLGDSLTLLDPTTEQVGQSGFIVFIQDGTGSRGVSLDPQYKTAGGVALALSGAAGAIDVVPYIVSASGSILLGTPQLAFA